MNRIVAFLILTLSFLPVLAAAEPPKIELKPCVGIPGLPPEARCGTYEV